MPITLAIRPPRAKLIFFGNTLAKSFAVETTFAAMFTASIATMIVTIATPTISGLSNLLLSSIGSQIGTP
jgi:hypothetical protein